MGKDCAQEPRKEDSVERPEDRSQMDEYTVNRNFSDKEHRPSRSRGLRRVRKGAGRGQSLEDQCSNKVFQIGYSTEP